MRFYHLLPAWVLQSLAAIGVWSILGFFYREVIKPVLQSYIERSQERRDQPVWLILKEPKYQPMHTQGGKTIYSTSLEIPYPFEEIVHKVGRPDASVIKSLKRLESRGKVKELSGGWQRKEK